MALSTDFSGAEASTDWATDSRASITRSRVSASNPANRRFAGNDDRNPMGGQDEFDVGKHAWTKQLVWMLQSDLDAELAGLGIDGSVDLDDLALKRPFGKGVTRTVTN